MKVKLGVNIDHVATLRQARGGKEPDLLAAAFDAVKGGAESITIHLREDRRHIQDEDVLLLKKKLSVPLNLEMSIAVDIVRIACHVKPKYACLVPEKRKELTTEGGLDVAGQKGEVAAVIDRLQNAQVLVSLFIDPIPDQVHAAYDVGADYIELHTGCYANAGKRERKKELKRLHKAAQLAIKLGLGVNAGHGLNYQNVSDVAAIPGINELNIGHSIVSRAVFLGLRNAVREMRMLIKNAC